MNYYILQHRNKETNRYYVYLHKRLTDNSIFYVGKGCGSRAWNYHGRNNYWTNIKNKYGIIVEILFDNLSEEESLQAEIDVIKELKYFNYTLANFSSGGDSPIFSEQTRKRMSEASKGRKKSKEHNLAVSKAKTGKPVPSLQGENHHCYDRNEYKFIHNKSGEIFYGTRTNLCNEFNLKRHLVAGLFLKNNPVITSQGWSLFKEENGTEENT